MMMSGEDEVTNSEPVKEAPVEEAKPEVTEDKKYIEFQVPEGYVVPEEAAGGKEFDAVATLKVKEDGSICLVAIDGSEVANGAKQEEYKEEAPEDDGMGEGFLERVNNRMEKA